MSWRLDGTYFENCNCEVACPCGATSFLLPADNERCQVVFAFHIERGEIEGVDVSDLIVALVGDTPGKMADGGWRVGAIMDERASEEQAQALVEVFSGQKGGPMGAIAPLVGEILGMETAAMEYSNGGPHHRFKAGDLVEMEVEDVVPEGMDEPSRLVGVGHPVNSTLTVALGTKSQVGAFGLEFSNEGKNAHSAPFSWAA